MPFVRASLCHLERGICEIPSCCDSPRREIVFAGRVFVRALASSSGEYEKVSFCSVRQGLSSEINQVLYSSQKGPYAGTALEEQSKTTTAKRI